MEPDYLLPNDEVSIANTEHLVRVVKKSFWNVDGAGQTRQVKHKLWKIMF
jgi:hypothetical protein